MTALESLVLCLARQAYFRLTCREDDFSRADQARELDARIDVARSEIAEREWRSKIAEIDAKRSKTD